MSLQSQFDVINKDPLVFFQTHDVIEDKGVKSTLVSSLDLVGCVL